MKLFSFEKTLGTSVCVFAYVYIYTCININFEREIITLRESERDTGEVGGRDGGVEMV